MAVHCFCVCSGSALLGIVPWNLVLLSVLSIYPRIFLRVFIVNRLLLGLLKNIKHHLLYSAICSCVFSCFGLVVSTCQVVG